MAQIGLSICRLFVLLAVLCNVGVALGQRTGDLLISPTRVQLSERTRSGTVVVANLSNRAVRYKLSLVDMVMMPDGTLKRLDGDSENTAKQAVRFSPKEITLAPGASQTVRILANPCFQAGTTGEVRSHLEFVPVKRDTFTSLATDSQPGLRLTFDVRFIVTIPVIVEWGKPHSAATLTHAELSHNGQGGADVWLHRSGETSVRGDLTATFKSSLGGAVTVLGKLSGLAIYYPNSERTVHLSFTKDLQKLGYGTIEISFSGQEGSKSLPSKVSLPVGG